MRVELNFNDTKSDFILSLLANFKEHKIIDEFEVKKEIDLTEKLENSLNDVLLMRQNKKPKQDFEEFLNEL
jgi:hypothetical protein